MESQTGVEETHRRLGHSVIYPAVGKALKTRQQVRWGGGKGTKAFVPYYGPSHRWGRCENKKEKKRERQEDFLQVQKKKDTRKFKV